MRANELAFIVCIATTDDERNNARTALAALVGVDKSVAMVKLAWEKLADVSVFDAMTPDGDCNA